MSIQISVLIWTILSFCILMFILDKFLFKPVLKVMDDRRSKIENYHEMKKMRLEENEKKKAEAELARANAQKEAMAASEKALEQEKINTEIELKKAAEEYDEKLEQIRTDLKAESEDIENQLNGKIDELVKVYASKIVS